MSKFAASIITILALISVIVYKTFEEEDDYSARLRRIAKSINSRNLTWKAENPTRFAKMTSAEIKAMMGGRIPASFNNTPDVTDVVDLPDEADVPESFNSITNWPKCSSISEIRDQSECGACWAFSTITAMSDRICITSGQVKQTRISARDLISCCTECGKGCHGGDTAMAWEHFKNKGLATGDLYGDTTTCQPYPFAPCARFTKSTKYPPCPHVYAVTPTCTHKCIPQYGKTYNNDLHYGNGHYLVIGEKRMKAEISASGPISNIFFVYEDFLTYTSGIYQHNQGKLVGPHAVKILGYGSEGGVKYWLVANSWNDQWGENGFFRIRRGVNECGIEIYGVGGIIKTQ